MSQLAHRALVAAFAVLLLPFALPSVQAQPDFEPRVGQAGKDVIWVPTPNGLIERMLRMANAGPADHVVDLGSGDGRIPIAAVRDFNVASATGIEYNPSMVALSNRNAAEQQVGPRVKFIEGDIFATDFSHATIVTMYLLPSLNLKLRPTILAMKPGTRIVSHAFTMEDWRPDDQAEVEGQNAYFWIVPAQVGGTWRLNIGQESVELRLAQTFQDFTGIVSSGNAQVSGSLRGDEIRVMLPDGRGGQRELVGKVSGEQMTGKVGTTDFTGIRTATPR